MTPPTVVGRAGELGMVTALVRGALDGRFGALVVVGDAGAGKTTLLRAGCEVARGGALVLEGACLPLTSVSVPLIGLRTAVRALPEHDRPAALGEGGRPTRPDSVPATLPVAFDDWLSRLTSTRPVVLVVDDLQWADPQTLDALTYVLAGPALRPLAVLLAVRSAGAGPLHPVRGWLADVRRLPRVEQCPLGPLSRDGVEELVAQALGGPAHSTLVDDVARRSGGNPYFARLLLDGVDPSAWSLPRHLPGELRDAATRTFATLSEPSRRLLVALAVGGRPALEGDLARAAAVAGLGDASPLVEEAVAAGVLDVAPGGAAWFHHPVQAEVVEQDLLPHERRELNARFAEAYAEDAGEEPGADVAETISNHHLASGRADEAYRWAVAAAGRRAETGDGPGRLRMLRRAVALHPSVAGTDERLVDLLEEVRVLARELADWPAQHEAVQGLRRLVDPRAEPLRSAVLDAWAQRLSFRLNLDLPPGGLARALELSEPHPASWQRAVVLCEQARALLWSGDVERARAAIDQALAAAGDRARGREEGGPGSEEDESDRARALAEVEAAMLAVFAGDAAAATEHAARGAEAAARARDGECLFLATTWEANAAPHPASTRVATLTRGRRLMERLGVPQPFLARLAGAEALAWLDAGDAAAGEARLRVALGAGASPRGNGLARLAAALLATRLGRQAEAEAHLLRAREVLAGEWAHPAFPSEAVAATVHLGRAGGAATALDHAHEGLGRTGAPPSRCEWLAPLAARALADLAGAARDVGADPSVHLSRLAELRATVPRVVRDVGPVDDAYRQVLAGLQALYDAECARAAAGSEACRAWVAAVEALHVAALPWEEAYACWRAAEALLGHGGASERREAAAALRRGHALAVRLGDDPVRSGVEALARAARLRLAPVQVVPAAPFQGLLSPREREVLAHVVAGRTYAEIAGALVLSEKTVSSHISNILRKTGTANRVELAAWATRTEQRS